MAATALAPCSARSSSVSAGSSSISASHHHRSPSHSFVLAALFSNSAGSPSAAASDPIHQNGALPRRVGLRRIRPLHVRLTLRPYLPPQASINKNYVDMDEYLVTTELQIYGDRFNFFMKNFDKSFGSTLRTLHLINETPVYEQDTPQCSHKDGTSVAEIKLSGADSESLVHDIQKNTSFSIGSPSPWHSSPYRVALSTPPRVPLPPRLIHLGCNPSCCSAIAQDVHTMIIGRLLAGIVVSVGAALFLFQELAGINVVVYYSTSVFCCAGASDVAGVPLLEQPMFLAATGTCCGREVLVRIEESEGCWPSHRDVVACAGFCQSWRGITKEIVSVPEVSRKLTFPISVKQIKLSENKVYRL
ncbi:hypothetical protein ABZP36_029681 [Zizania latifolia]